MSLLIVNGCKMVFDVLKEFGKEREQLLKIIVDENYWELINEWVINKSKEGFTKEQIYDILLKLFSDVQTRPDPDDKLYDRIADFLDGFTTWNKGKRILPDEPDL